MREYDNNVARLIKYKMEMNMLRFIIHSPRSEKVRFRVHDNARINNILTFFKQNMFYSFIGSPLTFFT